LPKYFILNREAAGSFRILVPACVSHIQEDSNLYISCCEPRMCGSYCVSYCCVSLVVLPYHAAVEPQTVVTLNYNPVLHNVLLCLQVTITTRQLVSHLAGIRHYEKPSNSSSKNKETASKEVKDKKNVSLLTPEKGPWYALFVTLGGSQGKSGWMWGRENPVALLGFEP